LNKKIASQHHRNTTDQTRHIKIHHPNQCIDVDQPKLKKPQKVVDKEKMSSFTNEAQQTKCYLINYFCYLFFLILLYYFLFFILLVRKIVKA
jgi:hypothetical protein